MRGGVEVLRRECECDCITRRCGVSAVPVLVLVQASVARDREQHRARGDCTRLHKTARDSTRQHEHLDHALLNGVVPNARAAELLVHARGIEMTVPACGWHQQTGQFDRVGHTCTCERERERERAREQERRGGGGGGGGAERGGRASERKSKRRHTHIERHREAKRGKEK